MFYVKSQVDKNTVIVAVITHENVYTRCPDCGCEIPIDLNSMVDHHGQLDLSSTGVCCPRCSRIRWTAAHHRERSSSHVHQ